jgi:hypothetical protein
MDRPVNREVRGLVVPYHLRLLADATLIPAPTSAARSLVRVIGINAASRSIMAVGAERRSFNCALPHRRVLQEHREQEDQSKSEVQQGS